jgi:hypothetical protein
MDQQRLRELALSLPETAEQDHFGIPSFRVRGKIFATVPDDAHVRVRLDEEGIRAALAERPDCCAEFYWGKRLACVVVSLARVPEPYLVELLTDAWLVRAPKRLAREYLEGR